MLFLSWMMFSHFRYPSFKGLSWKSTRSLPRFLLIILVAVFTALNFEWMPFALFLVYLLYGFLRPFLSREMKRGIEEEDEEITRSALAPSPDESSPGEKLHPPA
jgi:CDP-diacylglycerol--serine O-phosphatidyltransferase